MQCFLRGYCIVLVCFLLCFNKCTLYARGQTAHVSAKPCGLNFHRLGLPLIFIRAYPRPQRVRFTDCGAKVFPVLGSATSTEVLQSLQCLGCSRLLTHCYMQNYYLNSDDPRYFCLMLQCCRCNEANCGTVLHPGQQILYEFTKPHAVKAVAMRNLKRSKGNGDSDVQSEEMLFSQYLHEIIISLFTCFLWLYTVLWNLVY